MDATDAGKSTDPVTPAQNITADDNKDSIDAAATATGGGPQRSVPYGKHGVVPTDLPANEQTAATRPIANNDVSNEPGQDRAPIQISSPVNVQRLGPNIEAQAEELQTELGHNKEGRYGVNGEGVVGFGPTLQKETASPVPISSPVRVERLGPNIEAQADRLTNELEHERGIPERETGVAEPPASTLDPRARETETGNVNVSESSGPNLYSKQDAAAAPIVIPAGEQLVAESAVDDSADLQVDDNQAYKISVPRTYSHQEDEDDTRDAARREGTASGYLSTNNVRTATDNHYPLPDLSTKHRDSVYDTKEGQFVSKVPVPELNDIDDDDEHDSRGVEDVTVEETREDVPVQKEPSLGSYEKIPTPTHDGDDKYQVIDEGDVVIGDINEEVRSDPESEPVVIDTLTEPVGANVDHDDNGYVTPQVDAEPTFAGSKGKRPPSEVGALAFVMNEKLTNPHEHQNFMSGNFAGSQFVKKNNNSQLDSSPSSRGLQGKPKAAYVSDEAPQETAAGAATSHQPQVVTDVQQQHQPQQQQEVINNYSSSAEPSGDTLPTTQSKHNVAEEEQQQYRPEDLEGVVVEEKTFKGKKGKKDKKEKKEKKPSKFKERMLKYFVSGYEN